MKILLQDDSNGTTRFILRFKMAYLQRFLIGECMFSTIPSGTSGIINFFKHMSLQCKSRTRFSAISLSHWGTTFRSRVLVSKGTMADKLQKNIPVCSHLMSCFYLPLRNECEWKHLFAANKRVWSGEIWKLERFFDSLMWINVSKPSTGHLCLVI